MAWTFRLARIAAAAAALAPLVSPAPALAQMGVSGDYGPANVCVGGYAFSARASEGLLLLNGQLRVLADDPAGLSVTPDEGADDGRKVTVSTLKVAGLGTVRRYVYPTQDSYRAGIPGEMVGYRETRHTDYILPAVHGGPAVRVESAAFTGGGGDIAILRRFSPRTAASRCDPLRADPDGTRLQEVTQWSPASTPGPAFVCQSGIGLAVRADETVGHTWLAMGGRYLRITGPGYRFAIFGGRIPQAMGKPKGGLLAMGYRVEARDGGATLFPPASYPADMNDNGLVYVNAAGLDETALTAMLRRLEYVGQRDGRCGKRD